ncbi:hypothetical protein HGRIS_005770 [Hohenbuehelia grisea]|uniref:C3H1-type domain-containing protein n=1 Tax=Hohenbuehelia grisea TaxID=104357 RepID=A0ABR3K048_9AGAR
MHPHNASPESPASKRRHTRACKFFQINTCPHSAEECDFAHILTGEPAFQNAKPCRYYMAGHCSNGVWCRYKHPLDRTLEISDPRLFNSPDIRDLEPALTQQTLRMRSPSASPEKRFTSSPPRPTVQIPPARPVYPSAVSPPWPAYSYPEFFGSPNAYQPDVDVLRSPYIPHAHPETHVVPPEWGSPQGSNFSDDMSEGDFAFHGSSPPRRGPASSPVAMAPQWAMTGTGQYSGVESFVPMYQPRRLMRLPSPESPRTKGRAANFKTKPCKFYRPDMGCPNGADCTFIHDKSEKRRSEAYSPENPSLPSRPLSQQEINTSKGFFPVSWRVIGGGVKIGSPQNDSPSDHNWAALGRSHDTATAELQESTGHRAKEGPSPSPPSLPASVSRRRPRTNLGLSLDAGSLKPLTGSPENHGLTTPTRLVPHVRPTSTPPTPGTLQLNMMSLFSAETP